MSVTLDTNYGTARIENGTISTIAHWDDCGPLFQKICENIERTVSKSPSVPDHDLAVAQAIVDELGGMITNHNPGLQEQVINRVY